MNESEWIIWEPIKDFTGTIYLNSFIDDNSGIALTFEVENEDYEKINIIYENWVISYRNTDEGDMLSTISYVRDKYGNDFIQKYSFFKVKNSSYVKWYKSNSCNPWDEVEHHVYITPNDIIEILSTYSPKVEILQEK